MPRWALPLAFSAVLASGVEGFRPPSSPLRHLHLNTALPSSPASIHEAEFRSWDAFHLEQVARVENLTSIILPEEHQRQVGELTAGNAFTYTCQAYSSEKIRFARTILFTGQNFNVFNLLIIPRHEFRLPMFGVDIVYLATHHVVAIDFQPQSDSSEYCNMNAYTGNVEVFTKWKSRYSDSTLPSDVSRYFSPYVIWRKAPHSNLDELTSYGDCFRDYLTCYCQALSKAEYSPTPEAERRFQREYLEYRIREDPAKNILNRCFGKEWTHEALTRCFFPIAEDS